MALAEMQHHTAPRGQMTATAGEEDHKLNYTATVRTHLSPKAASTVYYTCGDDEEVLAAGVRPAPLSEVAGPQERVQRHTVEQIEEFVPMVQILDIHLPREGVLEQVIVPPLPEVQLVGWVARVRAPLVAVPALAVPPTGLRDPTDAALEFEEEEEEDEELEEERRSTSPSTGSSTPASAPGACAAVEWRGAAKKGGAARSRTANKSSTLLLFVEQNVDAPVPQITVELTKETAEQLVDVPMPQTWESRGSCADRTTGGMQEEFVEVTQFIPHECIVARS